MQSTRWTLVARAGNDTREGKRALEELCGFYLPAVRNYFTKLTGDPEHANDLSQGLFLDLLARRDLSRIEPGRGRFRGFLFKAAQNFLAKERAKDGAAKRGGGHRQISLTTMSEAGNEPQHNQTAEIVYDRAWAKSMVELALQRLRQEHADRGKAALFEAIKSRLEVGPSETGYSKLASELGKSEGAIKVAVHRLRTRFRELLLAEARQTLGEDEDPMQELRELLSAVKI